MEPFWQAPARQPCSVGGAGIGARARFLGGAGQTFDFDDLSVAEFRREYGDMSVHQRESISRPS